MCALSSSLPKNTVIIALSKTSLFSAFLTGGPSLIWCARLSGLGFQAFSRNASKEIAMADPHERNGENERKPGSADDADLSARLKSLDADLPSIRSSSRVRTSCPSDVRPVQWAKPSGFRPNSLQGRTAGGILGWLIDRFFGTSPWGLIVCLILGFCAGMLNLMRAAGMVKSARHDDKR